MLSRQGKSGPLLSRQNRQQPIRFNRHSPTLSRVVGSYYSDFFKNPEKLIKLDYKIRDAIIDYFKKTDTLQTAIDHRVIIKP